MAGKGSENTLAIVGTVADLAGKLIFGPDAMDLDIGAPFKTAAALQKQNREEQSLLEVLRGTPELASLVGEADSIFKAGGLIKNPQVLQGQPVASNILPGEQGGMPTQALPQAGGDLMRQLAQMQRPQKPTIDYNSPEFAAKLADAGLGDLAQKVILSQAQQKPSSDLETIKTMLMLRDYESPGQKRQAELGDKLTGMAAYNQLMNERQSFQKKEQQALLKPKEIEDLGGYATIIQGFASLPETIPAITPAAIAGSKIPLIGPYVLSKASPEIAQLDKQLTDLKATKIFAKGGKQLTGTEKDLLFPTLPDLLEAPEFYPIIKKNTEARIKLAQLAELGSLSKGGRDVSNYIEPELLDDYKVWSKVLQTQGAQALQDPDVVALMEKLGIEGLIVPKFK